MTCAPLEKIHGVGFRGTWQREHLIMSMHIPCLVLLLMQSIQYLKSSVMKICCDVVSMVALRTEEAINALIWQRATKETHSGLPTVELAAYLAVSYYNDGAISIMHVLKELGITPGFHCKQACEKLDCNRQCHARRKSSDNSRERRKKLRNYKKGYSDHLEALEGPQ